LPLFARTRRLQHIPLLFSAFNYAQERSHYFDAGIDQNIPFGCSKPAARNCNNGNFDQAMRW